MTRTVVLLTALALASAATLVAAAPGEGGPRAHMMERLKAADTNGDGLISRSEAAALPRLAEHFDEIDANKDGQISFDELRAFHQAHRGAHGARRQRRIDARGVAAQQVELQRREIRLVDPRLGEISEPGVDAVDGRVAVGLRVDDGARGDHTRARVRGESDFRAIVGDGKQVGKRQMCAV